MRTWTYQCVFTHVRQTLTPSAAFSTVGCCCCFCFVLFCFLRRGLSLSLELNTKLSLGKLPESSCLCFPVALMWGLGNQNLSHQVSIPTRASEQALQHLYFCPWYCGKFTFFFFGFVFLGGVVFCFLFCFVL